MFSTQNAARLLPSYHEFLRLGMQRVAKLSISALLNDNKAQTFAIAGVFILKREKDNKNCTLTLKMPDDQNTRKDIMELAIHSLATGKIALLKYRGVTTEELATLNQASSDHNTVFTAYEDSQDDPPVTIPPNQDFLESALGVTGVADSSENLS